MTEADHQVDPIHNSGLAKVAEIARQIYPLPKEVKPYAHQVAGHVRSPASQGAMLKHPNGQIILKVVQDYRRAREITFYETIFADEAPEGLRKMRNFLPSYHGLFQCPKSRSFYIGLTDLLAQFVLPNACDVKLGQISYLPDTTVEDRMREESKYAWRRDLGFVLSGMQVYDQTAGKFVRAPKNFGLSLAPDQVYRLALRPFLGASSDYRRRLAAAYSQKLRQLLLWFDQVVQPNRLSFCRSSLLLAHNAISWQTDGKPLVDEPNHLLFETGHQSSTAVAVVDHTDEVEKARHDNNQLVEVRLIDFAHWRSTPHDQTMSIDFGELDAGVRHGIATLIGMFESELMMTADLTESDHTQLISLLCTNSD